MKQVFFLVDDLVPDYTITHWMPLPNPPKPKDETIKLDEECAKWVKCETADYHWCCSKCGFGYTDNKLYYCYDCGAKMLE